MLIKKYLFKLFALLNLFLPCTSFADFSLTSAAVNCDNGKSWTLIAVDVPNDAPDSVAIPADYKLLTDKNILTCKVGEAGVNAVVNVYPPGSRGMGMGTGYVSIDKLTVKGLPVLPNPKPFNWSIPGSDSPMEKISVFLKDDVPMVEICNADKCDQVSLIHDRFMNHDYQEYLKILSGPDRMQLQQEQRFWLKERDPTCRYAVLNTRNEPLAFLKCVMTSTRLRDLRLGDMKQTYLRRKQ